ncbi:TniQ family protein [Dermacoccus abyssi]
MHIPGNPPGSGLERVLLDKRSGFYAVLGTEPPEPVKIPLIDDGRLSESVPKNTSSRYCPECLASGFGWSTLWQQPWTFACPHHHIALIATCPSCGQRPWSSSSWGGRLAGQACCTEREPRPKGGTSQRSIRPWCNGNLGDAAQIPVHDAALHAQQRLLVLVDAAHRDPGGPRSLGPWSATASQHLHTFCALLRLSVAQARSASSWADHLARASAAFDDLNQTDGSGPTINLMLSDHQTTGLLGPRSQALRSDLGPILVAAGIRNIASAIPPSSRLTFRTARAWAAHPPEWTSPRDHGQHILQEHQTERAPPAARKLGPAVSLDYRPTRPRRPRRRRARAIHDLAATRADYAMEPHRTRTRTARHIPTLRRNPTPVPPPSSLAKCPAGHGGSLHPVATGTAADQLQRTAARCSQRGRTCEGGRRAPR